METKVAQLPLADRLWLWFDNNRKQALWGALIVVGVGVIGGYYIWNQGEKETEAGEALSRVAESGLLSGGARPASPEAYLKVAAEYSGTPAAPQAVLLAAGTLFTEGKFAEAQNQFQRFLQEFSSSPFVSQAMFGKAACLEAQGKLDEAVRAYSETSQRYPTANVAPQAKFALARIYESQNKTTEARTLYEEVARSFSYHSLGNEAAMRAEELKMNVSAPKSSSPLPTFQTILTNLLSNPAKP